MSWAEAERQANSRKQTIARRRKDQENSWDLPIRCLQTAKGLSQSEDLTGGGAAGTR